MLMTTLVAIGDFDPPYFAYYEDAAVAGTAKAHKLLEEAIEIDGPFDGIVGFSQGAGLALSYLLHHRITNPEAPPPFKFALFFSTSFVLSPDPAYKEKEIMAVLRNFTPEDVKTFLEIAVNPSSRQKDIENGTFMKNLDQEERDLFKELGWQACSLFQTRTQLQITDKFDFFEKLKTLELPPEAFPRFFNTIYTTQRLDIPTVHCFGRNDLDCNKRLALIGRELCAGGNVVTLEHTGRHELPMRKEDVTAVANAVEKAFFIGQQQVVVV